MNYINIYNNLMSSRKTRNTKDGYYEVHHIVPKSLGGSNEGFNLIKLTAREHYIAHWLLTKIYPNNYKMLFAFSLMSGKLCPKGERMFSSSKHERCKLANVEALKAARASGEVVYTLSEKGRASIVHNMKTNNPIKKNPSLNWAARDVIVTFVDGSYKSFSTGVEAASVLGIPYSTWKWALRNTGGSTPKHGILSIVQGAPKPSNKRFNGGCSG